MSRSHKKNPLVRSEGPLYRRWAKRQANKAVRKYTNDIINGKFYKKVYDSWYIYDYHSRMTFKEWMVRADAYHLMYWNGGGHDYIPSDPERRKEKEREEYEEYGLPPDKKAEYIEWARIFTWK
ncbi:unnamed protein product [marine sediment metagenome]|uniref:Uncharacterized protein n=1 Tax=marine sediment metagenome TaxID=412755 RepID=X0ZIM4_9ZZZZ